DPAPAALPAVPVDAAAPAGLSLRDHHECPEWRLLAARHVPRGDRGGVLRYLLLRAERAGAAAVAARAPDRVPADGRADAGRLRPAHAARAVHARQLELGD